MTPRYTEPVACEATGSEYSGMQGSFPSSDDSHSSLHLQACHVRERIPFASWPMARAVAELHFGRAA